MPYPDEMLLVFHEWLDSKYPIPPGHLKIHGEFYTVWGYLNVAALSLCAAVGGILGFVCRKTGPVGITYWHERIRNTFRKRHDHAVNQSGPQDGL
jgi:hypothetical protein